MAIVGLKSFPPAATTSPLDEAVGTTIALFRHLDLVEDEQTLRGSIAKDYARLHKLGTGRLYVELPSAVSTARLIELANTLAAERGFDAVYRWASFWIPGSDRGGVSEAELNGSATGYAARLALFASDSGYDPLLHFTGLSYDEKYRERKQLTQLESVAQAQTVFANQHAGASLRAANHRDFLVWYIMNLIRGVPAKDVVLAQGFMRVPVLGRRTVGGDSFVGGVYSRGGQANFVRSSGYGYDVCGVGLSAGFVE